MKKIIVLVFILAVTPLFAQHVDLAPELLDELSTLNFNDDDIMEKLNDYYLRGADLGATFQHGETLLMKACYSAKPEPVKYLLDKGLNPNSMFDDGSGNPLTIAIGNENPEIVRLLLAAGADVNINMNSTTVLHELCFFKSTVKRTEILKDLIAAKADVNRLNVAGYTPLIVAVLNDNKEYLKILISAGADVNLSQASDGKTALKIALEKKDKDVISILKKAGAK